MKKFAIVVLTALVAVSCLKRNDLTNYAVPAKILSFGVEGQLTVTIDAQLQKVHVLMPAYTDLTKLTVTAFSVTDGVSCEPEISVGEVLNLFEPLEVILSNEDVYFWTIDASTKEPRSGVQLYNMNFDSWTQEGKAWYAYGADATDEQKAVWGNANKTITDMGKDVCGREGRGQEGTQTHHEPAGFLDFEKTRCRQYFQRPAGRYQHHHVQRRLVLGHSVL